MQQQPLQAATLTRAKQTVKNMMKMMMTLQGAKKYHHPNIFT
jgi:hypothetical protein